VLRSFVIRLVPRALASGELVGELEDVEDGRTCRFRNLQELQAALLDAPAAPQPLPEHI
jgi:hypothetical protein